MNWQAQWIWVEQRDEAPYNQTIFARRQTRLKAAVRATLAITADSWYRVYINGRWVNDGPCRSWPEHYQYDLLDVTPYLETGDNEILVIARYFGCGTFHQVPQRPGLLAQLEVEHASGGPTVVATDANWEAVESQAWLANTPKVSIQMEPAEHYDARLEARGSWEKMAVICGAEEGPWQDLQPRDCALLTREPAHAVRHLESNVVRSDWLAYTFNAMAVLHPGLVEANFSTGMGHAVATRAVAKKKMTVHIESPDYDITVNGRKPRKGGAFTFQQGDNFILATLRSCFGHQSKQPGIRFVETGGFVLSNPLNSGHANPWAFLPFEGSGFVDDDLRAFFSAGAHPERDAVVRDYAEWAESVRKSAKSVEDFAGNYGGEAKSYPPATLLLEDSHWPFMAREVVGDASGCVRDASALLYDNAAYALVEPSKQGDVELAYDLGQQRCGYWDFEIDAPEGTIVDIFAIEYIASDGALQHTLMNRNGLRYYCKEGVNRFTSLKRRSGRYLYLTLRNQSGPVHIRRVNVIESTYPVDHVGRFECSDAALERIWEIASRALLLCMEDTFTDCPLYEQTHWVGDARNEAVFAMTAFGATDLAQRCARLSGQSLERYPLVGCQVPSSWDILLPAWSFLWGISIWDYYFYTGDKAFLKEAWPWVKKNLKGSEKMRDAHGLFTGPFWNMFDWAAVDQNHETVLHNSMFIVGAIDAALKCAKELKDQKTAAWLREYRKDTVKAINEMWDEAKGAYADSVHENGDVSEQTCQHTSFLALLYDIAGDEHREAAVQNCLNPPEEMTRVGSPFALMYFYEALDKEGLQDEIVQHIRDAYQPMLDDGATTVWESFPSGSIKYGDFPTRSHCHGWSSAPIYFLNRIVLGIEQTAIGGTSFTVSPRLNGLRWARGVSASAHGPIEVDWRLEGNTLEVRSSAPEAVTLRFRKNETHEGLEVRHNGRKVK